MSIDCVVFSSDLKGATALPSAKKSQCEIKGSPSHKRQCQHPTILALLKLPSAHIAACCLSTWLSVHEDGKCREKKYMHLYLYILYLSVELHWKQKVWSSAPGDCVRKREPKSARYHNSIYRFIISLPQLFLLRTKEGSSRSLASLHFIAVSARLSSTHAQRLWARTPTQ